ncbi:hypothetical protein MWL72_00560 [Escherichia coli]|nr:hypothetical protein [Escherichia coli]
MPKIVFSPITSMISAGRFHLWNLLKRKMDRTSSPNTPASHEHRALSQRALRSSLFFIRRCRDFNAAAAESLMPESRWQQMREVNQREHKAVRRRREGK